MPEIDNIKITIVGEDKATPTIDKQIEKLKSLSKQLQEIAGLTKAGKFDGIDKFSETLKRVGDGSTNIAKFANAVSKLKKEKFQEISDGIKSMVTELKALDGIDVKKLQAIADISKNYKGISKATKIAKESKEEKYLPERERPEKEHDKDKQRVEPSKREVSALKELQRAFKGAQSASKKFFSFLKSMQKHASSLASNISNSSKAIGKFGLNVAKSALNNNSFIKTLRSATGSIKGFSTRILQMGSDIARIIKYRAIRNVIKQVTQGFKEGVENAYQWAKAVGDSFAESMDTISTASLYAKNSLGALAMPIINTLAPAIDYLTDKFVSLLNFINEMIAALTGAQTWTKAIKYPTEWAEAAEGGASGAKKAVDEYKNTILGIDEINPLNDTNDRGTGGGGGSSSPGMDYSSMFETQKVSTELSSALSNWGETLADKLNAGITKINSVLDKLPSKAKSAGESFANQLNNLNSKLKWDKLGEAVGKGVNTVISGLNGFYQTFDFAAFGTNIATAVNSALDKFDATAAGTLLGNKFNAFWSTALGFAETLNWDDLGTKISEGINGFFDKANFDLAAESLSAFINGGFTSLNKVSLSVDWTDIGNKLSKSLNKFIEDTDASLAGKAIGNFIAGGLTTADIVLGTIDWTTLGTKIGDSINGFFNAEDTNVLSIASDALGKFISGGFNALTRIALTIDWTTIGKAIGSSLNSFIENKPFTASTKAVSAFINGAFESLGALTLSIDWQGIVDDIAGGFNTFISDFNWEENGKITGDFIYNAISSLADIIDNTNWAELFKGIGKFATEAFKKIWPAIKKLGKALLDALGEAIKELGSTGAGAIVSAIVGLSLTFEALQMAKWATSLMSGLAGGITSVGGGGLASAIGAALSGNGVLAAGIGSAGLVLAGIIAAYAAMGIIQGIQTGIKGARDQKELDKINEELESISPGGNPLQSPYVHDVPLEVQFNLDPGNLDKLSHDIQERSHLRWNEESHAFVANAKLKTQAEIDELASMSGWEYTNGAWHSSAKMKLDYEMGGSQNEKSVVTFINMKEKANARKELLYDYGGATNNNIKDNVNQWFSVKNETAKKTLEAIKSKDWKTVIENWSAIKNETADKTLNAKKSKTYDSTTSAWNAIKDEDVTKNLNSKWKSGKSDLLSFNEASTNLNPVKSLTANWKSGESVLQEFIKAKDGSVTKDVSLAKEGWDTLKNWVEKKSNSGEAAEKKVGLFQTFSTVKEWIELKKNSGGDAVKEVGLSQSFSTVKEWIEKSKNFGGSVKKEIGLKRDGWTKVSKYVNGYTGDPVNKKIGLTQTFDTVAKWIEKKKNFGGSVDKEIGLKRDDWTSVASYVSGKSGGSVTKSVGLSKLGGTSENAWAGKTVYEWIQSKLGNILNVHLGLDIDPSGGINVEARAMGGTVASGQLFMARENGMSEYVGSFGSQAAVANNDQIVSGIAQGVAAAQGEQNRLLREQNDLLRALYQKEGSNGISSSDVLRALQSTNSRAGHAIVQMG